MVNAFFFKSTFYNSLKSLFNHSGWFKETYFKWQQSWRCGDYAGQNVAWRQMDQGSRSSVLVTLKCVDIVSKFLYLPFRYQCSQLNDAHVNGLISAASKNKALVFVDVRNNPDVSPELLDMLDNSLKANSLNSSQFHFKPIEVAFKQPAVVHRVAQKHKPSTAKPATHLPKAENAKKKVKTSASAGMVRYSPAKIPLRSPAKRRYCNLFFHLLKSYFHKVKYSLQISSKAQDGWTNYRNWWNRTG